MILPQHRSSLGLAKSWNKHAKIRPHARERVFEGLFEGLPETRSYGRVRPPSVSATQSQITSRVSGTLSTLQCSAPPSASVCT